MMQVVDASCTRPFPSPGPSHKLEKVFGELIGFAKWRRATYPELWDYPPYKGPRLSDVLARR